MHAGWSPAARSVWGKTDKDTGESLPLVQHLEDAAGVAGYLWDTWIAPIVRHRLVREIGSHDAARNLTIFLAGTHDVGKASPAFAQLAKDVQMGHLLSSMERAGLRSPTLPRGDRERHTLTGHVAMEEWLRTQWDYAPDRATALASLVSAHHGTPAPDQQHIARVRKFTRSMGDEAWDVVRGEILNTMTKLTGAAPVLKALRETTISLHALIDLSALVIVADWISSDSARFPYDLGHSTKDRLDAALETLDLRAPWSPDAPGDASELFAQRFPHLGQVEPTPLQRAALTAAREVDTAPLMLIEAPTGAGKSEAAFMAAEMLAARFGAGGAYVGLPTMATSNAMFGRVLRWVDAWPTVHDPTLWLAHGKAALNDDFAGLVSQSRVRAVYDEEDERSNPRHGHGHVRVSGWLFGRKRGMLANVVVGTIDQVLMGALQARHLALRHLALSSKVVIVDEVHSADTHMRSYLVRMLEYLGGYGTPVILLSATLPPVQRQELVEAYQRGRRARVQPVTGGLRQRRRIRPGDAPAEGGPAAGAGSGPGPEHYPLITVTATETSHRAVEHDARTLKVQLEAVDDDLESLVLLLEEALADGGCVAVIRNTVRRAQETFDILHSRFGDEVELFHSRFLAADRATRERALVDRLGPPGAERPQRLVVVGTQVLEQSLDIDLDLLVTDLAPVDLVIQRIGRLHRHQRPAKDRPAPLRKPRCLITGVENWSADITTTVDGSRRVYAQAHLLRAASVLRPYLAGRLLSLPEDGPVLVHEAYDPHLAAPQGWEQAWADAEEQLRSQDDRSRTKATLGQAAQPWQRSTLTGWTATPTDDQLEEAGRAQVRDSEDGVEVILVQLGADGALRLLPGGFTGAGSEVPIEPTDEPVARYLAACTVGLPMTLTNPRRWESTVTELESNGVADDWQRSRWLAGQLALAVDQHGRATLNEHLVTYSSQRGLEVTPTTGEAN